MRSPGCSISEDVMCLAILSAFHMQLLPEVRGREWKGKAGNRRKGREGKRLNEQENVGKRWR